MALLQAAVSIVALATSLLPTSCDGYFRATPFSLESGLSVRTPTALETNRPRASETTIIGTFLLDNGRIIELHDTDGDGIVDQARDGHRRWEILPEDNGGTSIDGQPDGLESSLPHRNPEFGNRTAEDWIAATGLDGSTGGVGVRHPVWVHSIRTSRWFIDLTIPATSECLRPSFHDHAIAYQWDVLSSDEGPDFETWRIAGDMTEVCRFIVSCGIHELKAETVQGLLEINYVLESNAMSIRINGIDVEWIPLD